MRTVLFLAGYLAGAASMIALSAALAAEVVARLAETPTPPPSPRDEATCTPVPLRPWVTDDAEEDLP